MAKRDPFKIVGVGLSMDSMKTALKGSLKKPTPGVTQGGSSRKFRGAKVAATVAEYSPSKSFRPKPS